ncbi:hypothetical protein [Roseateles sp.]|uniref:hypothetical protein n=1 Tax=Roseateles sp. TaxID=1971397 RepID=UPI002F4129FE
MMDLVGKHGVWPPRGDDASPRGEAQFARLCLQANPQIAGALESRSQIHTDWGVPTTGAAK